MTTASMLNRIEAIYSELPKSEKKVASAVLKDPEFASTSSIHTLAVRAETSAAAIVRFCKSLGLPSFPDFKRQLYSELVAPKAVGYYDFEENESFEGIAKKLLANYEQTLNDTAGQLNKVSMEQVSKQLEETETIYAYGVGASWLVAQDFAQKWLRAGKQVIISQDEHVLAMAFAAKKTGVFFVVSNSGETSSVLELAEQAKENKLTVIGLTRFGPSKLKNVADIILETSRAPEAKFRSTATSSKQAQFFLVDVLYYYYLSRHYEQMIEQIRESRKATDRFRK